MASCSAVMITCGSTPFSFDSASMVCCSGLLITSKFHFQMRPRDVGQGHAMPPAVAGIDEHLVGVNAGETPFEVRLSIHRLTHHDLRVPAREPNVVADLPERPVEPRRRNLERIR